MWDLNFKYIRRDLYPVGGSFWPSSGRAVWQFCVEFCAGTRLSFGHAACTIHFKYVMLTFLILQSFYSPLRHRTASTRIAFPEVSVPYVLYETRNLTSKRSSRKMTRCVLERNSGINWRRKFFTYLCVMRKREGKNVRDFMKMTETRIPLFRSICSNYLK